MQDLFTIKFTKNNEVVLTLTTEGIRFLKVLDSLDEDVDYQSSDKDRLFPLLKKQLEKDSFI